MSGLLNVAETVEEDYKITTEKESLEQIIRSEMIAEATTRKDSNSSEK